MFQNIEAIIIDYGDVIFDLDFQKAKEAFIALGIENVDVFYDHLQQNHLFDQFDMGKISPHEFRQGIREVIQAFHLTDEEVDKAYNALLVGVPKGRHELLLKLKDKYRTFLLSNNNAIHYEWIMDYLNREYGLKDGNNSFFEKCYYSHLMGKRKPNPDIFQQVIEENQLNPENTLFLDDSPQHIARAKQLGLKTVLLTRENNFEKIAQQLFKLHN